MSPTLLLPPRAQLCNRSCSNKTHTPVPVPTHTYPALTPPWVGSRSPDGWDQIPRWAGGWACTSHPGVLGSIPKREEPGKTGRHPVLKYRVPHGSHANSFVKDIIINRYYSNKYPHSSHSLKPPIHPFLQPPLSIHPFLNFGSTLIFRDPRQMVPLSLIVISRRH